MNTPSVVVALLSATASLVGIVLLTIRHGMLMSQHTALMQDVRRIGVSFDPKTVIVVATEESWIASGTDETFEEYLSRQQEATP